ncbi:MAG: SusE domain-containing protein [Ferruginibacter sp.]
MKNIFKYLLLATGILFLYSSCKKVDDLPYYANGSAVTLTSSASAIAPPTADSNKTAVTFSWSNPKYAADSAATKYIIQIDSSGRNFKKAISKTITGSLSYSYIAKELNAVLLSLGFAYNTAYDVDVRIVSSYANNNEQYQSNVLKLKMTPYVTPPKVVPPVSNALFLVGSATAGGWGNPVPVPAQQFIRVDSVDYQGTFFLNGGGQYLLLPVNGNWDSKFAVQDNTIAGLSAGGDFGLNAGSDFGANFPGPAASGMYKITLDFQHGKFTVVPVGTYGQLWVPGDYQGWTPATAPSLGSQKNDGSYDGYVNIPSGGTYEFKLAGTPDWNNAFGDGAAGGTSGTLVSGGSNNLKFAGPGYYRLTASTVANTWSATATTWGLIGSFAASSWNNDVAMTYSASDNKWTGTITTVAGDQFKFRANHDWGINLGETGGTGSLSYGGDNIGDASKNFAVPAGTHTISLFLNNSGYYTYMLQ